MVINRRCLNTFDDFKSYCEKGNILLNDKQRNVAKELFSMPRCSGKSLLIALLYRYDPPADFYLRFGKQLSKL